jgi:flagellar biosynthesis GTPase FlhF
MDKNALEQLLSSYNWWMGISTVAVAVGILGEYVAHFIFEKEARNNRLEMTFSILLGALVLGGVVGEYIFGEKLSQVSNRLQQMADSEVAQANKDAARARKDAELARQQSTEASERAAKAEQHAAQENARAAKALESAETAKKNAESFQLQIANANERAANAELQTERLRRQLADRTLSDDQITYIGNSLKPFKGQPYTVTAYWDSKESLNLANRIHVALQAVAGWSYSDEGSKSMMLGGEVGVMIWTHPDADESTGQAAKALINVLNTEGIEAEPRQQNPKNPKSNTIAVNVGSRR